MSDSTSRPGTHAWTVRTGGHLTAAEAMRLLVPVARSHLANTGGRVAVLARMNAGRRARLAEAELVLPSSDLTRAAAARAQRRLPPVLLNHAYRTYIFAAALAGVQGIDVDKELLFAASMLHDIGLSGPPLGVDFTLAGARAARDVAEEVGLSTAGTDIVRNAITLHASPDVTLADGPVAYLLAAGAAVDSVGLRSSTLPPGVLSRTVAEWPRQAFKISFAAAMRAESAAVPAGRTRLLYRYGGLGIAVAAAPFDS